MNSAKVLGGVSPQALIAFISDCYGPRASDQAYVDELTILGQLEPFRGKLIAHNSSNADKKCATLGVGVIQPTSQLKEAQCSAQSMQRTVARIA